MPKYNVRNDSQSDNGKAALVPANNYSLETKDKADAFDTWEEFVPIGWEIDSLPWHKRG